MKKAIFNIEKRSGFFKSTEIKKINRESLTNFLYALFKNITLKEFVSLLTNKFIESIEYAELINGKKSCQKTSLLFNPHRLNIKTKNYKESIYKALSDKHFISGLSRAILFNKRHKVKVSSLLYHTIQLGINGRQYANEFPPHIARDICKIYNLKSKSKILDPCAGWGGRMIGISVVSNHYFAYEPATKTYQGLLKLKEFIKQYNPDFKCIIKNKPFEKGNLPKNKFDFAITSPPYYDTEIYSNEKTNSCTAYNTFKKWVDCFYLPLIKKTMHALKPGSIFILNIGSRKYPLNKILLKHFNKKYKIKKLKGHFFSNTPGSLGKSGEGETLYEIKK